MQLREQTAAITGRGAEPAAIGTGSPREAADLASELGLEFPLFTDPDRRTYAALGTRRSVIGILHTGTLRSAVRAWRQGHRQDGVQGDPMQLGGVVVIRPGGMVAMVQRSVHAGDHPDIEAILQAI